ANLTAIPAGAAADDLIAFDTGPANMVIDACMERLYGEKLDRGGSVAALGKVLMEPLAKAMRHSYFKKRPPKTAGREEFGREFVNEFVRSCGRPRKEDIIATATALTAMSIGDAI